MLNIAICDDDKIDLRQEKELIEEVLAEMEYEYTIDSYSKADELLNASQNYHIIFLDVEMDGINGIDVAEAIHKREPGCFICFVTNYASYMDEALNKHAFRFWSKPIHKDRLVFGIQSAVERMKSRKKVLTVHVEKHEMNIVMSNIIYVYTENRMTYIVTVQGLIQTKDIFKGVKQQLNEQDFCEVHASYCVNMKFVSDYTVSTVTCNYKDQFYQLKMSKSRSADFRKRFTQWSGGSI